MITIHARTRQQFYNGQADWRLARAVLMGILLPDTWRRNRASLARGRAMLADYPAIPDYHPELVEELWAV